MKKWYEKLSKKELVHLIDSSSEKKQEALLETLRHNLQIQKELGERCSDCESISNKLNIKL